MAKDKKERKSKEKDKKEKIQGNIVESDGKITFENPPTEFNPGTLQHEPKISPDLKKKLKENKEEIKDLKEKEKKPKKRKSWIIILIAIILIALLIGYFWFY